MTTSYTSRKKSKVCICIYTYICVCLCVCLSHLLFLSLTSPHPPQDKNNGKASKRSPGGDHKADDLFGVFQLAFESRYPRVIEVALDGLNDLIENGYLRGASTVGACVCCMCIGLCVCVCVPLALTPLLLQTLLYVPPPLCPS